MHRQTICCFNTFGQDGDGADHYKWSMFGLFKQLKTKYEGCQFFL